MKSVNPATGETLATFEPHGDADVEARLHCAVNAFHAHRRTTFAHRAERMLRLAELLEREQESLGRLMTLEMGKPIRAAREEAAKCARACRYYAEHAERFLAPEAVPTEAASSGVRYQPLGVVLAIMPWNFPFWQVMRFAAPAVMAGNVGVLKHASNVPQCAQALEDLFQRAGFAEGVFQALLVGSDAVPNLIEDRRIAAVTLTGSEGAGSSVGAEAGRQIKKCVLELGGSDPYIVMPSADVDAAARAAVTARTINNGQSCIAAKRFIVHEAIADEFERRFVEGMRSLVVGDPMDDRTQVGPLATRQILEELEEQVRGSVALGARVVTGGHRLVGPGNFYAPTVLTDLAPDAPARREETFGPVAALIRVPDLDEAIAVANEVQLGLGASAWTMEAAERERLVEEIESGMVFVNAMVASDPRLPFGGVKRSGYGRELGAIGIREFVNIKTVWEGGGRREEGGGVQTRH
ncbi:MAG TPA: NAD-dependent succinate-semialdehyde dehydrogenase [Gemmatimonadaceae bacterium]|jgi:succinate-semialdehyde dehydrogenase/glutarate-semialdehyde dehydrogenase|nr:NAD-dependent succinate-semialdehyde dehydrogenase [Gemmatimonadaceae bacterium]